MIDTTRYLFRGKRVDNGEWVEGFPYIESGCSGDISFAYIVIGAYESNHGLEIEEAYEVIPETVGMYTGLTDKNGVRIFEGDILVEDGHHFVVQWDDTWAKYRLRHNRRAYQYPEWNRGVKMVHVGNIHDNPELMEAEK